MKKRIFLGLVLAAITAGGVFGQAWYNSYAPGIEGSRFFINGGIGFGVLPYKMSIPPISASVEYGLPNIPLSLGAYFGITGYKEDFSGILSSYGILSSSYKGTRVGFGAKASYHFNFLKNLDPYVSLVLGWMVYKEEHKIGWMSATDDLSTFYYGFNLGTRYFFTKNIGAYVELGYSAISIVSAGLSLKF
jgi:hypothetical protein